MRPKGIVVYSSPENPLVAEAEKHQRQERLRLQTQRAERYEKRVLKNEDTYPELYERWKANGGGKLFKCRRCDCTIHWGEPAHICPGYQPKFVEHDDEWKERAEARREAKREALHEAIREARRIVCSVCGEEMPEPEDGQWHWDAHEGRPEREHLTVDGEPDGDLDGYEDWCDEDESYVEDDGDPDWD